MRPVALAPLLAVACWLALLPWLLRTRPDARRPAAVGALALAVVAVGWALAGPLAVPVRWLMVLREGPERTVIDAVISVHPWVHPDAAPHLVPLRLTAWLHALESTAAVVLLGVTAASWGGRLAGIAVPAAVWLGPWGMHAPTSDAPTASLAWLTMLGAHLSSGWAAPGWRRPVALVGLGAAVLAAASLRHETLLLGLPAVLGAGVLAVRPDLETRAAAALRRAPALAPLMTAVLLSSLGLYAFGAWARRTAGTDIDFSQGVPWGERHLASLRLPLDMLAGLSPGAALAALGGVVLAVRVGVAWAWLATSTLLLSRLYAVSGHFGEAPYETLRYEAYLLGPLGLLVMLGAIHSARVLPARARPLMWAALVAGVFLPRPLAPPALAGAGPALVETTQSEGARFLVAALERWPSCLLVTRLRHDAADGTEAWETAYYGGPLGVRWPAPRGAATPEELKVAGLTADAGPDRVVAGVEALALPCAVFVAGLDCALPDAACDHWLEVPELVVEADVPELNTHHPRHEGRLRLMAGPLVVSVAGP